MAELFEGKDVYGTADYLCRVVSSSCAPNKDVDCLMSAFRTMAWAIQQFNQRANPDEIKHRLRLECSGCQSPV